MNGDKDSRKHSGSVHFDKGLEPGLATRSDNTVAAAEYFLVEAGLEEEKMIPMSAKRGDGGGSGYQSTLILECDLGRAVCLILDIDQNLLVQHQARSKED